MMKNLFKNRRIPAGILSVILAFSILLSTFSGLAIFADNAVGEEPWDGTAATEFKNGAGTKENPYLVSTPAELLLAVSSTGKDGNRQLYYKMVNDIYVNDISDADWKADAIEWSVVSTANTMADAAFGGVFNGNGYKVFGLYVSKSYQAPATVGEIDTSVATGLFPAVTGAAKISAVGVEESYFSLTNDDATANKAYAGVVGVIAGYVHNTDAQTTSADPVAIDRCYVADSVSIKSVYAGLVGMLRSDNSKSVVVTNCYGMASATVHAGVTGNRFMIVSGGDSVRCARLEYCYAVGGVAYTGCNSDTKANYCNKWVGDSGYATKLSTTAKMQGLDVFSAGKMEKLNDGNAFIATETYPILRVFLRTAAGEKLWDGSSTAPEYGEGSETKPYLIENGAQLHYIIKNGGETGKFYKLTNDIYLNDPAKINWATGEVTEGYKQNSWLDKGQVTAFSGTIDGDGHTVYGLYYTEDGAKAYSNSGSSVALIPTVAKAEATIKNLGIDCAYLKHPNNAGAFVGYNNKGKLTVDQCYVGEKVYLSAYNTGAIVSVSNSQIVITSCYSLATIDTADGANCYGLVGDKYTSSSTSYKGSNILDSLYNANGPISNKNISITAANSYATAEGWGAVVLTADNMQGMDALTNSAKMNKLGDKYTATTTYPMLKTFAQATVGEQSKYWDGETVYAPTTGEGTETAPYEIENAYMLAYVIKNGGQGKYYKLTNDIFLNKEDGVNWLTGEAVTGYTPNIWYHNGQVTAFSGTIDGDGHTVYGLYYTEDGAKAYSSSVSGVALIPTVAKAEATIKNLGIDCAYLKHPNNAGAFVGYNNKGKLTVDQCYVGEKVYLSAYNTGAIVSASNSQIVITSCYSLATIDTADGANCYGLVGDKYTSSSTSYKGSNILDSLYNAKGPISTKNISITAANSYATAEGWGAVVLTADKMQGLEALSAQDQMWKLGDALTYQATASYPILRVFSAGPLPPVEDPETFWNGNTATFFAQGSGTEADPYIISKGSELALMLTSGGNDAFYKLSKDIYLNDVSNDKWYESTANKEWFNGTTFNGTLDGNGHCVYGIWYPKDNAYESTGLVPFFSGGAIKNIGVRKSYIHSAKYAGGIVGKVTKGANKTISQCFVDETVTVGYTTKGSFGVAGIVGMADSLTSYTNVNLLIENCYSKAYITGENNHRVNGILGSNWKSAVKIVNSYSVGVKPYYMRDANTLSSLFWNAKTMGRYTEGAAGLTDINNVLSGIYTDADGAVAIENVTKLNAEAFRKAADQPTLMPQYDFADIWVAVEGGTPKLKIFSSINGKDIEFIWSGMGDDDDPGDTPNPPTPPVSDFAGGTGSETDPYIIKNATQLKSAITSTANKHYKLANDIYVNDVSAKGWYLNETNTEWVKDTKFKGHLDGDGHCVYGIWYPESNTSKHAGLIPIFQGGSVRNIGVRYSYIYAVQYAGGIAGMVSGTNCKFEQCFADDSVMVGYTGSGSFGAGGIMGYAYSGSSTTEVRTEVTNCYSKATVTGVKTERTNGLVGTIWKSSIKLTNCYSVNASPYYMASNGTVSSLYWDYSDKNNVYKTGAAGLTDINNVLSGIYTDAGNGAEVENYTNIKAEALRVGADQAKLMPAFDFVNVWTAVDGGTPVLKIFSGLDGKDIDASLDGIVFSGGTGSKTDPYIIKTVEQLRYLVESNNTKNKYYKLANDLYINDTSKAGWVNTATEKWYNFDAGKGVVFNGNFDGDGHYIYGICVNETPTVSNTMNNAAAGLFPKMSMYATIRNVHVRDSYISGVGYVGSIVGYISASGTAYYGRIIGCSADNTVDLKGQTVGGLLGGGARNLEIHYSYFTGQINATSTGRGNALVGDIWSLQHRVVQAYSIGYANYRTSFIPSLVKALYGTVSQAKTTLVAEAGLYGEQAKTTMPDLNWNIWYTVNGKTPHMKPISDDMLMEFYDEGERDKVWSGLTATKFAGGTGSETDPYLIETPEQLVYFVDNLGSSTGKYYKLIADIKLNDTSKVGWEETANSWVTSSNSFTGNFDGDGHVVSGLYYNGSNAIVALIPRAKDGAVIKRLGVTRSTIINLAPDKSQSYTGAILGKVDGTNDPAAFKAPFLSECFANDSVYLEGGFVGGLVGGGARSVDFENCYFTGNIVAEGHCGAFFGNQWNGRAFRSSFTNCYAVTPERVPLGGNQLPKFAKCMGVYLDGDDKDGFVNLKIVSVNLMKGDLAKENMPALDYANVWKLVKGGTPVLRCFKNAEQYSSKQAAKKVEISFATEGGETVEPIYGETGLPIGELPTPTYFAHNFVDWYVNKYKVVPFTLDTFPNYDMVLYAKWERYGFEQGFETDIDEEYDINEGVEIFRPGSQGYNPKCIHGGMRALRTIPESEVDPIFLVNYVHPFEIGMTYDVTFWVYAKEGVEGSVDFLHANHPQVDSPVVGYTTEFDLSQLKSGKWTQIKTTIVANAPYLLVRTTKGAEVFFDDFQIVPTFKEGKLGELEGFNPGAISGEPGSGLPLVWLIVIIAGGVILLGGIATTAIILVKKNKKTA